jgi:hypothetical protein
MQPANLENCAYKPGDTGWAQKTEQRQTTGARVVLIPERLRRPPGPPAPLNLNNTSRPPVQTHRRQRSSGDGDPNRHRRNQTNYCARPAVKPHDMAGDWRPRSSPLSAAACPGPGVWIDRRCRRTPYAGRRPRRPGSASRGGGARVRGFPSLPRGRKATRAWLGDEPTTTLLVRGSLLRRNLT